ncbi:MAG: glycosyltransferase [Deltaproteobacteria bacterium]|nr:glycosyltransferase [Deltaproteobacteria bacterium]
MTVLRISMIGLKGLPGVTAGWRSTPRNSARNSRQRATLTSPRTPRPQYTTARGTHRGVRIKILPTIPTKHLDATVHSFLSAVHASFSRAQIVHFHGIGPALFSFIPRLFGKTVVTTMHSRDYLRSKWGPAARFALRLGERMAFACSHAVICVSRDMADAHAATGKARYVPSGVPDPIDTPAGGCLKSLGLAPRFYLLYAGRVSPEKGPHHLLRAFKEMKTDLRLVLAGGPSHNASFEAEVDASAKADERVVMTGYVDGGKLAELYANARGFVLPSEHEGLPIALLEAGSYGVPCACTDIPAVREAATDDGGDALVFLAGRAEPAAIRVAIEELLADGKRAQKLGARFREHVLANYRWEAVAMAVGRVYREAAGEILEDEQSLPCPSCGQTDKTLEYSGTRSGRVARCAACGMVFSISPPPKENLPPAFTDDPDAYLANARHRLGVLNRSLTPHPSTALGASASSPVTLLDVGCFDGHFAAAAAKLGFDVTGVEPVAEAAAKARARHGLDVRVGAFENADLPAGAFDAVSFIHVFEHLKNPRTALARARQVLKPGGYLLIELPAYDALVRKLVGRRWRQFISDHDRFYTGPVLRALLESEEFAVLHDAKVGKVLTPRLLADRLGRYYSRAPARWIGRRGADARFGIENVLVESRRYPVGRRQAALISPQSRRRAEAALWRAAKAGTQRTQRDGYLSK